MSASNVMNVKGLRVLIVGGASGAGRTIAEIFAETGAKVLICGISEPAIADLPKMRPEIGVMRADISRESEIDSLFDYVDSYLGGLDVLVNNAGIAGPTVAAEGLSLSDWTTTFDVNLTGYFLCARSAIPRMKAQKSGSIINISSISAKVGLPMRLPYAVSKAAVLSLTQNLARELGPFNIRVNAILPGLIEGDRMRRVIASKAKALSISEAEYEAQLLQYISMRTMVTASDVAAMALFLASDASRRVSGQMIAVDGHLQYEV